MCFRYVLGVYNKRSEVMKMYDTEMITLQPQILGNDIIINYLHAHSIYFTAIVIQNFRV